MSHPNPKFEVGDQVQVVGCRTGIVYCDRTTIISIDWGDYIVNAETGQPVEPQWLYTIALNNEPKSAINLRPIPPESPMTWEALRESLKSLPLEEQAA